MTAEELPLYDDPDDLAERLREFVAQYGYVTVLTEVRKLAPTIIQASAPARWTDPETSHHAAKRDQDVGRFSSKSRQAKLLQIFSMRDLTHQGATVALVGSHAAPSAFDGCRRRCSDLVAVGYLMDTGRRRKNPGSDDLAIVWTLTDAGRAALVSLDATGWSR